MTRIPSDRPARGPEAGEGAAALVQLMDGRGDHAQRLLAGIMAGAVVGAALAGLALRTWRGPRSSGRS